MEPNNEEPPRYLRTQGFPAQLDRLGVNHRHHLLLGGHDQALIATQHKIARTHLYSFEKRAGASVGRRSGRRSQSSESAASESQSASESESESQSASASESESARSIWLLAIWFA